MSIFFLFSGGRIENYLVVGLVVKSVEAIHFEVAAVQVSRGENVHRQLLLQQLASLCLVDVGHALHVRCGSGAAHWVYRSGFLRLDKVISHQFSLQTLELGQLVLYIIFVWTALSLD